MVWSYWAATPQALSTLIIRFFLSEPSLIEGWFVPLHRHPAWSESRLRRSIAQAQGLAWEAWEQVYHQAQEQRRHLQRESDPRFNAHPRAVAWEEWFACQWIPLEPEEARSGEILWVRRDLQDAFRVRTRCPECGQEAVVRSGWRSLVRAEAMYVCLACDHYVMRLDPRVPVPRDERHQRG